MSRRFPPGGEPGEDWPPPKQLPKPATPGPSDATSLLSENSVALPIAYGTVRTPGLLLERYVSSFNATDQATRQKSATLILGTIQANSGNLYIVATAGTTGTGNGPSGTGSGQADGTVVWDYVKMGWRHYVVMAFCEGLIYGALKGWQDKNVAADWHDMPHDTSWVTLNLGTASGGRAGFPFFPSQTDVYGNTVVFFALQNTGSDSDLPDTSIEIQGIFADGTHADANPADIAIDLLTHARRGAQWPSARVDSVSTGGGAASWRTYATAAGFTLSWLIDQQTSAKVLIEALTSITNTDAVMTNRLDGLGWMIKFVPLGTDSITANGVTFTPNLTPVYTIGADDLIDPIEFDVRNSTETFNSFPVEYVDRATDYKRITVDDADMSDVDLRGLVRAPTTTVPMVLSPAAAVQLSRINAQRSLNVRNKYRFSLPYRFLLLEPTDLLTLTDSVVGYTVTTRVVSFEEDQGGDGLIRIEAEDFPSAVGAATGYTPQTNDGLKPTMSTALTSYSMLPGQASTSVVPDSTSTRGGAVDNLWPNFNSEISPPDGLDTTTAEWTGRTSAVAAYAGTWTRTPGLGASLAINYDVAAAPDETYYFEAQVKATAAAANKGGFLKIEAFDKDGTSLGSASSTENDTASFVKALTSFLMPAGTVRARFSLKNGTDAAAQAYFDVVYARKAITAGVIEASQVVTGHTSLGQYNTLNYWPNPTSEIDPPASYIPPGDGTDAEFDFRYNAGAGAYSGAYVRRLIRTTAGTTTLDFTIPSLDAGDCFVMYWYYKFITSSGAPTVTARIQHLDKDKALIGERTATLGTGNTTWTVGTVDGNTAFTSGGNGSVTPAGTVYTRFRFQLVTAASGTCEVHLDWLALLELMVAARIRDGAIVAAHLDPAITFDSVAAKTDSDQTESAGTFTNITNMSFALAANGMYAFEAIGSAYAAASSGISFQVTGPASPTLVNLESIAGLTGSGLNAQHAVGFSTALTHPSGGIGTSGSPSVVRIYGIILNGANAGTAQLQFAWSGIGTSATVKQGWILRWRKIG